MTNARVVALVLALTVVGVLAMAGGSSARSRSCRGFELDGSYYNVTIHKGRVRCKEARHTLRAFLSGQGTERGSGPESNKYWTLPQAWKCGHGAGGGACI